MGWSLPVLIISEFLSDFRSRTGGGKHALVGSFLSYSFSLHDALKETAEDVAHDSVTVSRDRKGEKSVRCTFGDTLSGERRRVYLHRIPSVLGNAPRVFFTTENHEREKKKNYALQTTWRNTGPTRSRTRRENLDRGRTEETRRKNYNRFTRTKARGKAIAITITITEDTRESFWQIRTKWNTRAFPGKSKRRLGEGNWEKN